MANKLSAKTVAARLRAQQALQLRIGGATFDQIAKTLGYRNRGTVYHTIKRELERGARPHRQVMIDLQEARLDQAHMKFWSQLFAESNLDILDQTRLATQILAIMKRRADLLGLDAPKKQAQTTAEGEDVLRPYSERTSDELIAVLGNLAANVLGGRDGDDPDEAPDTAT